MNFYGWHNTGAWVGPYLHSPARWQGRAPVEDHSVENIRAFYNAQRKLPYQSAEDHARYNELEAIAVAEELMTTGVPDE